MNSETIAYRPWPIVEHHASQRYDDRLIQRLLKRIDFLEEKIQKMQRLGEQAVEEADDSVKELNQLVDKIDEADESFSTVGSSMDEAVFNLSELFDTDGNPKEGKTGEDAFDKAALAIEILTDADEKIAIPALSLLQEIRDKTKEVEDDLRSGTAVEDFRYIANEEEN